MQLKSLRYIKLLLTKELTDKFKFSKGLSTKMESFSPPSQSPDAHRVRDRRPLCPIRYIGKAMQSNEFHRFIWTCLAFLTKPHEVVIALLRNIHTIFKKVERRFHKDFVDQS
jgi:hypothetical protein